MDYNSSVNTPNESRGTLEKFRKAHGLNSIQTARLLRVSKQTISYWDSTVDKQLPPWIPLMLLMIIEYCELKNIQVIAETKAMKHVLDYEDFYPQRRLIRFMKRYELSNLQMAKLLKIDMPRLMHWIKGRRNVPKWARKIIYLLHIVRKKSNKNIPHRGHWSKSSIGWSKWSLRNKYYFTDNKDLFMERICKSSTSHEL